MSSSTPKLSEVTIRIVFANGQLDVTIQDDGSGFHPADNISGHGLSNMRKRLQKIGGQCFVDSNPGHGTTVRMRLEDPSVRARFIVSWRWSGTGLW